MFTAGTTCLKCGHKVESEVLKTSGPPRPQLSLSGLEPREFQPSRVLIADVSGDGANDLILLAHDRVLIYLQMSE